MDFFYKILTIICNLFINIINFLKSNINNKIKISKKINNLKKNYFDSGKKPNAYKNINSSSLKLY